ncbi:MAG: hypothetical protein GWP14_00900 [Actinobacteria bacterium]|nr:hypothetical protein [Actinomycetota bacterium]
MNTDFEERKKFDADYTDFAGNRKIRIHHEGYEGKEVKKEREEMERIHHEGHEVKEETERTRI